MDSVKVVIHESVVWGYEEFIGRVACDYFGLCTPLSVEAESSGSKELTVVRNESGITITTTLDKAQDIEMQLFDPLGRSVKILMNGMSSIGLHSNHLNRGEFPSSWYLLVLNKKGEGKILSRVIAF
jgi:hypothetical protein